MKLSAFEAVAKALHQNQVQYLVADGLAVNAHGHIRNTMDIDLVIALNADNIHRAFDALASLNYHPLVPITADHFADETQRQRWRSEKGMTVLNFQSDNYRGAGVDVFVYEPFDFAHEYSQALHGQILPGIVTHFVSVTALIDMKRAAGRPLDMDDIQHLQWLQEISPDE